MTRLSDPGLEARSRMRLGEGIFASLTSSTSRRVSSYVRLMIPALSASILSLFFSFSVFQEHGLYLRGVNVPAFRFNYLFIIGIALKERLLLFPTPSPGACG